MSAFENQRYRVCPVPYDLWQHVAALLCRVKWFIVVLGTLVLTVVEEKALKREYGCCSGMIKDLRAIVCGN